MASTNPFDLLVDDDNDDVTQLLAKLPAAAPAKKAPAAGGLNAKPAAKLPTKPLPPSQAVQEFKNERGGGRSGGRGAGRGGRGGRGFNRDSGDNENSNGNTNGFNGGYRPTVDGEVDKFSERRGFSASRGAYRGARRGGYTNGDADGERPRRVFERRSGTGRGCMDLPDDIFGASINLEDIHLNEGFQEGYDTGFASGKDDGREVGLKTGFITGEELGFYRGCIDVWKSVIRVEPTCFSSRVQKNIREMDELVSKYPILEPENESVTDMIGSLRLKFRAICATLNVKLEYNGYPKASNPKEIQF